MEIKEFLHSIERFYQPENPKKKDGIGHEIEHIKGVCYRTGEFCQLINTHKGIYGQSVDSKIAVSIACLHDIGNVISRKGHNILGKAILEGKINKNDVILNAPDLSQTEKVKLLNFMNKLEQGEMLYSQIPPAYKKRLTDTYMVVCKFEMSYNGKNGKQVKEKDIPDFLSKITNSKEIHSILQKNLLNDNGTFRTKDGVFQPELKELTRNFQSTFSENEKQNILTGVLEHNIDFMENLEGGKETRYISPNIYARIIADADKDNVPETFAIRTVLYAINQNCKVSHIKEFCSENNRNRPNLDMCGEHVLHQARERFGYSMKEYYEITGQKTPQPIFVEMFRYKKPQDIKCLDKDGNPKKEKGDDIFYQLDAYTKTDFIEYKMQDSIDKMRKWSLLERKRQSLREIQDIISVLQKSKSVEEAVAFFEAKQYGIKQKNYTFENIVDMFLPVQQKKSFILDFDKDEFFIDREEYPVKREFCLAGEDHNER